MNRQPTAGQPVESRITRAVDGAAGPVAHAVAAGVGDPVDYALDAAVGEPVQAVCMPAGGRIFAAARDVVELPAQLGADFVVGTPVSGLLMEGDVDDPLSELMADDVEIAVWSCMYEAWRRHNDTVSVVVMRACSALLQPPVRQA